MMSDESALYEVRLAEPAETEIEAAYLYRLQFGVASAEQWYAGLERTFERLAIFPHAFPILPEPDSSGSPLRQIVYKSGKSGLRIVYRVREPEENEPGVVQIMHARPILQHSDYRSTAGEEDE